MLPRLVRQSLTSAQRHTTVSLVSYSLLRWSPWHCTRSEPVPPTCDILEINTPKLNVRLGSGCSIDTAVAGFCNQMDQQESVQFWPVLLPCATIGKANTLSETWDGCCRFLSSSYMLCNRDRLISALRPVWAICLQSPNAELNAKPILDTPAGNCDISVPVTVSLPKFSLSDDPALIRKLRSFST